MNLHDNQSLFAAAVQIASRSKEDGGLGIKPIFIEKDYWICRSLKFLSDSEVSSKAVFKGGTSLSKAYGLGGRFSEDIDIAITKDESRTENQTKNLIHSISKTMSQGLVELPKPQTRKFSKYRKVFYSYPSIADGSVGPTSITPGQILLEIVSFANPYPYHKKQIKSFVTEYFADFGDDHPGISAITTHLS
ncbi:MAG: nucleotidyl transferase AbiEii/AbiGii toxin family protein [Bacteroidales bacterium]|nr:nucleotidyl transferase AbiEii/AbiGii toxin family protein [Bacteroidales bacterium]